MFWRTADISVVLWICSVMEQSYSMAIIWYNMLIPFQYLSRSYDNIGINNQKYEKWSWSLLRINMWWRLSNPWWRLWVTWILLFLWKDWRPKVSHVCGKPCPHTSGHQDSKGHPDWQYPLLLSDVTVKKVNTVYQSVKRRLGSRFWKPRAPYFTL